MATKVAVVTGSNKGIGFAIVRGLCKNFDGAVYLTARDAGRGKAAVEELEKEGLKPNFHQLDISDIESVKTLGAYLKEKYGGLDILVNNAAIAYKDTAQGSSDHPNQDSTAPFSEQAEVSIKINFIDTMNVCDVLFPLLRPHARVVHVSSFAGKMSLDKCSDDLKKRFLATKTVQEVKDIAKEFVEAAKTGDHTKKGWANSAYGTSKMCVTQATIIQQKLIDSDPREDIVINACCPGYVATDMSSFKGTKTIDEGAETPLYVALLPAGTTSPKGNFVSEKKVQTWG